VVFASVVRHAQKSTVLASQQLGSSFMSRVLSYAKYAQSAARSAPILGNQSFEADVITTSSTEVFPKKKKLTVTEENNH
jgi:hypothetical protein